MQLSHSTRTRLSCLPLALAALAPGALAGGGANGLTEREVFTSGGAQVTQSATVTDVSANGRWLVFHTAEPILPEDANGNTDVYVLDRKTGGLQCASSNVLGIVGGDTSSQGRISDDGRYVVFQSRASNLIGLDGNGNWDVFRKDLVANSLQRVSAAVGGIAAANERSLSPDLSADGRYVVFQSLASNLGIADTNGTYDIYWRDMQFDTVKRISEGVWGEANGGSWQPSISDDGSKVAYHSSASNLVLFDANGVSDVFVSGPSGGFSMVSRNTGGGFANGDSFGAHISGDGARVVFTSSASDLVAVDANATADVFDVELASGVVSLISSTPLGLPGNGASFSAATAGGGRFVLFTSQATDLTTDGVSITSVFLRDQETGITSLVSRSSGLGNLPNGESSTGAVDAQGTLALFNSLASNLDQGDTNGVQDVFARTLFADPTTYCSSSTSFAGCQAQIGWGGVPSASANSGFTVTATDVPNNKPGILFYSFSGRASTPFLGGAVCMNTPVFRSPALFSGGNPGAIEDCSGSFTIDMNAFNAGLLGGNPGAGLDVVGQQVQAQFWGRDPSDMTHGSFLSNALEYIVGL